MRKLALLLLVPSLASGASVNFLQTVNKKQVHSRFPFVPGKEYKSGPILCSAIAQPTDSMIMLNCEPAAPTKEMLRASLTLNCAKGHTPRRADMGLAIDQHVILAVLSCDN